MVVGVGGHAIRVSTDCETMTWAVNNALGVLILIRCATSSGSRSSGVAPVRLR